MRRRYEELDLSLGINFETYLKVSQYILDQSSGFALPCLDKYCFAETSRVLEVSQAASRLFSEDHRKASHALAAWPSIRNSLIILRTQVLPTRWAIRIRLEPLLDTSEMEGMFTRQCEHLHLELVLHKTNNTVVSQFFQMLGCFDVFEWEFLHLLRRDSLTFFIAFMEFIM